MASTGPNAVRDRQPSRYRLTPGDLVRTPLGVGVITDWRDNTVYDPASAQVFINGQQVWFTYRDISHHLDNPG